MASSSIHPLLPPALADPTPKRDFPLPLPRRRPTLSREAKRNQPPSPLPPPRRCYRGLGASLAYTHRHHRHPPPPAPGKARRGPAEGWIPGHLGLSPPSQDAEKPRRLPSPSPQLRARWKVPFGQARRATRGGKALPGLRHR